MPKIIGTIRQFTGLLDTPDAFLGAIGKTLIVNSSETGLEFLSIGAPSGLESLVENSNTGYRIIGRDPAFFGDIGSGAVDFSFSDALSSLYGATGNDSFSTGYLNIASGYASFVTGAYNTGNGDHDTIFGSSNTASGYASLIVGYLNTTGSVYNRAYGQENTSSGGWHAVTDGYQNQALENYAYARGHINIARGFGSHAVGLYNDVNSLRTAFAFGDSCKTIADGSFLSGIALDAGASFGVVIMGTANETFVGAGAGDIYNATDPIFIIGNGTYNTPSGAPWTGDVRSNALFVDKGGRMFLPSVNNAMIDAATNDIVVTKGWLENYNGFVTLDTAQTITGKKTFTKTVVADKTHFQAVDSAASTFFEAYSSGLLKMVTPTGTVYIEPHNLSIKLRRGADTLTLNLPTITQNRTQSFQNKDGIIALTSDIGGNFQKVVTTTTYTLTDADAGHTIWLNNAAGITVTLNTLTTANFECDFYNEGAGSVIFQDGTAVVGYPDGTQLGTDKVCSFLRKLSTTTYKLKGELV